MPALTFFAPRPQHRAPPRPQVVTTVRPALVTTTTATLLRHPTPAPHHPAPGPSLAPIVVTQRYPSPSPIPHIWQPRGAVFTPKPFVHIHTSVQPVVTVTTTRAPVC